MRVPSYAPPMREKGLEPLRLTALDPKSSVSTNFTTLADDSRRAVHRQALPGSTRVEP